MAASAGGGAGTLAGSGADVGAGAAKAAEPSAARAGAAEGKSTPPVQATVPRDVAVVQAVLGSMRVAHYDPRIVPALVELYHRRAADILERARRIAVNSGRDDILAADVSLAVKLEPLAGKPAEPARGHLSAIASAQKIALDTNKLVVPEVPFPAKGLRLPAAKEQLTAENLIFFPECAPRAGAQGDASTGAGGGAPSGAGAAARRRPLKAPAAAPADAPASKRARREPSDDVKKAFASDDTGDGAAGGGSGQ